ncbi:hypothetical protein [Streptomyces sp. NPDC003943]
MAATQAELAGQGLRCEVSAAAGLAGLRANGPKPADEDGPVVRVATSGGYADTATARDAQALVDLAWED